MGWKSGGKIVLGEGAVENVQMFDVRRWNTRVVRREDYFAVDGTRVVHVMCGEGTGEIRNWKSQDTTFIVPVGRMVLQTSS